MKMVNSRNSRPIVIRTTVRRAVIASSLVFTTALSPAPLVASIATAKTIIGDAKPSTRPDFDVNALGILTIHKGEPNWFDSRKDQKPFGPISGIEFQAQRVRCADPTSKDFFSTVTDMTVTGAKACGFEEAYTAFTNARGTAVFHDLPVGLYLITEMPGPNPGLDYRTADPFLITVPIGQSGSWQYNVEVNTKPAPHEAPPTPPTKPPSSTPPSPPGNTPPATPSTPPHTPPGDTPPAGESTPPTAPGQPPQNPNDAEGSRDGALPVTGASIAVALLVGSALVLLGALVMLRRNAHNSDN